MGRRWFQATLWKRCTAATLSNEVYIGTLISTFEELTHIGQHLRTYLPSYRLQQFFLTSVLNLPSYEVYNGTLLQNFQKFNSHGSTLAHIPNFELTQKFLFWLQWVIYCRMIYQHSLINRTNSSTFTKFNPYLSAFAYTLNLGWTRKPLFCLQ